MSLSFGPSPLFVVFCLLGAGVLTFWIYRQTTPSLSPSRRFLLGGLRFGALALLLLLLLRPTLHQTEHEEQPPVLAVLVDESESMRITGGNASADEATPPGPSLREALAPLFEDLQEARIQLFSFSNATHELPAELGTLDTLSFQGTRTNIAGALEATRTGLRDAPLSGIILLSDGQYNTGRNPLHVAEGFPHPIHAIVTGDTTRQRDVSIQRITANEIGYTGTEQPVRVGIRTEGFGGERVTVRLLREDTPLASTETELAAGSAEVPVELRFTPEEEGLQRYTVEVSELQGEATYQNNTSDFSIRILDSRRHLLLVGGGPSPDFAAMRGLLERDPDTEVTTRVVRREGDFYEGALPQSFDDFDGLLLIGFPSAETSEQTSAGVAQAATLLPTLFVFNPHVDATRLQDEFEDVLPARPGQPLTSLAEGSLAITPGASTHPIFGLPTQPDEPWSRLPPLNIPGAPWELAPDARVLATAADRDEVPLLVIRQRAGHRAAALLGSGTWRWANLPPSMSELSETWPGLFENLVQWLAAQEDDRPVRVEPVAETFGAREEAEFTGQVYDESLQPVSDAEVLVEATGPDGEQFSVQMEPAGDGQYVASLGRLPEGTYSYRAEAQHAEQLLGTDRGEFAVGALNLEFQTTYADAQLMRQLAGRTGGRFLHISDAGAFPEQLRADGALSPIVEEIPRSRTLWHLPGFLAAIILLLSGEWFLRKRNGLV